MQRSVIATSVIQFQLLSKPSLLSISVPGPSSIGITSLNKPLLAGLSSERNAMPAPKGKKVEKDCEETQSTLQKGVFIFPNGDKYDGKYFKVDGGGIERSGYGEHVTATGVCYQGHWANDKMNGQGKLSHPSGSTYEGEFVDNQFHGKGTYTWPNGASYQGYFIKNRLEGDGNFVDVDKQQWVGSFHDRAAPGLKFVLSL